MAEEPIDPAERRRSRLVAELRQGAQIPALRSLIETLLREFDEWEAIRSRMKLSAARVMQPEQPRKRILCFDGLPGVGKTTHIQRLQAALGAGHFSMAQYARAREIAQGDRRRAQLDRLDLHPADRAFLEEVRRSPALDAILEKFPRTPVESAALARWANENGFRVELFFFSFPADPVPWSVRRQIERGPRRGKEISESFAGERAMKNLARGTSGRWALVDLGIPVHRIDATRPLEENAARIRAALGMQPEVLDFDLLALQTLDSVARQLGIEAWVGAGHFYRPFWNSRFGPAQRPSDVDVAVDRPHEVAPLLRALCERAPGLRWSVIAPAEAVARAHGIRVAGAREAKAFTRLLHRGGLVRWSAGRLELHFAPGAEAALRGGMLRINEALLERLSPANRDRALARAVEKIPRTLSDYPMLGLDARSCELLGPAFAPRSPQVVTASWHALKEQVAKVQLARRGEGHSRRALDRSERAIAEEILRFHRTASRTAEPPPSPEPVPLPPPLEALRGRERGDPEWRTCEPSAPVPAPDGSASWLHHLARDADDATFRAWLHDQAHHHRPLGGADPDLRALLCFERFGHKLRGGTREQSPMHQGWTLERHLAASALALETSHAVAAASGLLAPEAVRLTMRLAMLFHDVGKLAGPRARRRHAEIGARLFAKHRPGWFPREWVALTCWMIESHDLFGAFGRGLTEKRGLPIGEYELDVELPSSYPGALDAQAVRTRLAASGLPLRPAAAIARALWAADIGSIAALRWLLPLAELVEWLVLAAPEAGRIRSGPRRERRAWPERARERRR